MNDLNLISNIDFFRYQIQEIDKILIEIENGLVDDFVSKKIIQDLNYLICMLYEEIRFFIEELCEIYYIKWERY